MNKRAMSITVNGESAEVPHGCTVRSLLDHLAMEGQRVAVAVNHSVVPRSTFAQAEIHGGDQIEILEAVGGG